MKKCEAYKEPLQDGGKVNYDFEWKCDREYCKKNKACQWKDSSVIGQTSERRKKNGFI